MLALGYNVDEAHYNYGVLLGAAAAVERGRGRLSSGGGGQSAARAGAQQPGPAARGRRGNWPRRLAEYRQAVAANPQYRLARYNLGRMLLAARRFDDAIAEFEKLREPQDAESPRYWYGLAVAHVQAGRREEGLRARTRGAASRGRVRPARADGSDRPRHGEPQMRPVRRAGDGEPGRRSPQRRADDDRADLRRGSRPRRSHVRLRERRVAGSSTSRR